MAGVTSLSGGLNHILKADAKLSDFKLTKDGNVKERFGLGKLFTKISDHFANKSIAGRATVLQRNAEVGRAMLNVLQSRVDTNMGKIDKFAQKKRLAPDSETITQKKAQLTQMAQAMRAKVTGLVDSSQSGAVAIARFKRVSKTPEQEARFMKVFEGKYDIKKAMNMMYSELSSMVTEDSDEKTLDLLNKDLRRGSVKQFGATVFKGRKQCDDVLKYMDTIAKGSPEVKKLIMVATHQGGLTHGVACMVNNAVSKGGVFDSTMPAGWELVGANILSSVGDHNITLSADDAGNITIRTDVKAGYGDLQTRGDGRMKNLFSQDFSLEMRIPVDADGNFTIENGVPKFEMTQGSCTPEY